MTMTSESKIELSKCSECGLFQYPPRVLCCHCLSENLVCEPKESKGVVLADTLIHYSLEEELAATIPNHIGLIKLDAGPTIFANLDSEAHKGVRVTVDVKPGLRDMDAFFASPLS